MDTQPQEHCPLCKEAPTIEAVTHHAVFGESLTVAFCGGCELYYLTGLPSSDALQEYYSGEYFDEFETDSWRYRLKCSFAKMRANSQARFILSGYEGQGPGRILEAGSCDGTFLSRFKNRGWETLGLEFNDFMIASALKRFGLHLQKKDVMELVPDEGLFDVIAFPHVLEHMREPVKVLEHCQRLLKPGGMIFIELPQSPLKHEAPEDDYSRYFHTTHLYDFRSKSLARLIEQAGLQSVQIDRFFYSIPAFLQSSSYQLANTLMKGELVEKNLKGILTVFAGVLHLNWRNLMSGDSMERLDLKATWSGLGDNLRVLARPSKVNKVLATRVVEESPAKA
ncbi:MAG: class I SAM-dependent methyltransferase [Candidatus Nitronauta litoralis]|uniref:Class I SAM-dependent methyltransferase n=1 Tax=Candidatus Nitronauta litoralis TaxID=2705533 RepID=A0A7T0BVG0_9BACT|nr:MAG: class I SAM-dependent methyltransferase [Candidatus Nitronauta litoralis]